MVAPNDHLFFSSIYNKNIMSEAITVLEKAESVLMKRISVMRDGSPKWAASVRLYELRDALKILKAVVEV
jgi:hypothetical protein